VTFGPFVCLRFGRPSTPSATYLRLVFAYLTELGLLASAITRIAVTGLRITAALTDLAGKAAAEAEKVLVNARRALHRAVHDLTELPAETRTTTLPRTVKCRTGYRRRINTHQQGYRSDRARIERADGARTWTGHRISATTRPISPPKPKTQNQRSTTRLQPTATPPQPTADFFRSN
jgi:hypothetical protein